MEQEDLCRTFRLQPTDRAALESRWKELTAGWSTEILPPCLEPVAFAERYPFCESAFPLAEVLPLAQEIAVIARREPELSLLAHVTSRAAFEVQNPFFFSRMPDPLPGLGKKLSGMFALMIALGAYPLIVRAYAECGVPERYAQEVLKWFGGRMRTYGQAHDGLPGMDYLFSWTRRYIDGDLFRIGRLEYRMDPCSAWMPAVYRNASGEIAVLAGEGWRFRNGEYRAGAAEPERFVSHLTEDAETVTGTPIPPDGIVDFTVRRTLSRSEWHPAVSPWDLCPSVHIPGGGRMTWEEVKTSLIEARAFFAKYFHRQVPLFCCCSWILNPAWEGFLANSNIVRFRREGYAFPAEPWGEYSGMSFVFGRDDVPPDQLPAVNTIQKAFQKCSREGRCGTGGVFFLADDLEKLGSEYYRNKEKNS